MKKIRVELWRVQQYHQYNSFIGLLSAGAVVHAQLCGFVVHEHHTCMHRMIVRA